MFIVGFEMILTCQSCQTRYLVPNQSLGIDGRRVRCTHCSHEWFQEPEDSGHFDMPDNIEPIPEGVKPIPEGSAVPALLGEEPAKEKRGRKLLGKGAGYAAAAAIFLLVAGALYMERAVVVRIWPPAYALYELADIAPEVAGEGLTLDRVSAVAVNQDGSSVLEVSGKIVNLRGRPSPVPRLQTTLRHADGSIFDSWPVEPPGAVIDSHGELDFRTSYPTLPNDVKEISVQLILMR